MCVHVCVCVCVCMCVCECVKNLCSQSFTINVMWYFQDTQFVCLSLSSITLQYTVGLTAVFVPDLYTTCSQYRCFLMMIVMLERDAQNK